jgi:hypothetical protein
MFDKINLAMVNLNMKGGPEMILMRYFTVNAKKLPAVC